MRNILFPQPDQGARAQAMVNNYLASELDGEAYCSRKRSLISRCSRGR
jgi:hypothetical protein